MKRSKRKFYEVQIAFELVTYHIIARNEAEAKKIAIARLRKRIAGKGIGRKMIDKNHTWADRIG